MTPLATAWTIAKRDLRGRFAGLRLLLVCLFLGVATLATIGSLTEGITSELANRGQSILGGDIEVGVSQRELSADERDTLAALGAISDTIRMQAMARRPDGADTQLAELKGVDGAYPLYGTLTLADGSAAPPLGPRDLLIGKALSDRLDVAVRDTLDFGEVRLTIVGIIGDEPDRLSEGLSLGPVAITSLDAIRATGLVRPGSLFESKTRLRLPTGADPGTISDDLEDRFRGEAWEIRTRDNSAPSTRRFIERMGQFLTLVGLASLVIAGIGVGNGVAAYLRAKEPAIGTLKTLGAESATVFRIFLLQILVASAAAIAAGLVAGALLPIAIGALAGDVLPVSPDAALYPLPLVTSALYGFLIAIIFALPPLARARTVPAAGLFRGAADGAGWNGTDRRTWIWVGAAVLVLVALAVFTSPEPLFSLVFLAVVTGVLALLAALGYGIGWAASKLPRPRAPLLRLAIANLHRPGAETGQLVIALGLGLTLFATLAAIQTSLTNEIRSSVPTQAPDYFVLDVPVEESAAFADLVRDTDPGAQLNVVPTLRGIITEFGGQRVADLETLPDGAWVLRGDRGLTYSAAVPEGSEIVAGEWWPADYAGPPLVSVDAEQAGAMGVGVGDTLTISLLGVEIRATIASLREVNWRNFGFNYVLVFPPSVLAETPHNVAATIELARDDSGALTRVLPDAFPAISIVRVKDIASQIGTILNQMATAIGAAASIAILSGIAVLIGAVAASRQKRIYDGVVLKMLGATRAQVLGAQGIEYALLATVLALVALGLGVTAGWYVITQLFEFTWQPDWGIIALTLLTGAVVTLGIGLLGSLPVLSAKPAQALREL